MSCPKCNSDLISATYVCTTTDYRVVDSESNLIFIYLDNHEIPADDDEIGDSCPCKYCNTNDCKYVIFN